MSSACVARITLNDENNILGAILAAVSLGALGLVIAQMSANINSSTSVVKSFGLFVAMAIWTSSILLLATSIWRHLETKHGCPLKKTDWGFYCSLAVVTFTLMAAMVWLGISASIEVPWKK